MGKVNTVAADLLLGGLVGDDHLAGAPATFYLAVSNTAPSLSAGVISGVTEPTTGSYARVAVANDDASWTIASREATNDADVLFPSASADWDVSVAYYAIYDAATAGNCIAFGSLSGTYSVYNGVVLKLPAGSVKLTVAA